MSKLLRLFEGSYPDVAWVGTELHVVSGGPVTRWTVLNEDGMVEHQEARGLGYFPRTNGAETVYHDGQRFKTWRGVIPAPTDPWWGNCPAEIDPDGCLYWQTLRNGTPIVRMRDQWGAVRDVRVGAPTGIWEALNGTVVLWDEAFDKGTTHGSSGVLVSERRDNDGCTVFLDGGHLAHLAPDKWVYWPRLAVRHDGMVAIAWSDNKKGTGVWVWMGTKAELQAMPGPDVAPPPVTPPPVTPEPPKPPTGETQTMKFTDAEKATLIAFDAAFPIAAIPATPEHEDDRRAWTLKLAQTFKARFASQGWGTKRASETRPPSKDSLARWVDTGISAVLYSWDTTNATTAPLSINPNAESEDITGQVFIAVEAHDWLAVVPPQPPDPEVPESPDLAALTARVDRLERFLADTLRVTPF